MRVSDEILQTIRSRVSIVELVGQHVALKRTGKNWKGLCPFHSEKTPSFTVSDERGSYHCFGCGAGGTAFRFLMELEGKTFLEAVRALAERAGVHLTLGPEDARDRRAREERELLRELLELAERYYRHQLVEGRAGERARGYLERRARGWISSWQRARDSWPRGARGATTIDCAIGSSFRSATWRDGC
jgi:DNA primase